MCNKWDIFQNRKSGYYLIVGHTIYHITMSGYIPNMFGTMTMETTTGATPSPFQVGSALFYVVVAAGSILMLLITCIVVLSLCIGCVCLQQNRASTHLLYIISAKFNIMIILYYHRLYLPIRKF